MYGKADVQQIRITACLFIIHEAIVILNRFIEVYKEINQETWVVEKITKIIQGMTWNLFKLLRKKLFNFIYSCVLEYKYKHEIETNTVMAGTIVAEYYFGQMMILCGLSPTPSEDFTFKRLTRTKVNNTVSSAGETVSASTSATTSTGTQSSKKRFDLAKIILLSKGVYVTCSLLSTQHKSTL